MFEATAPLFRERGLAPLRESLNRVSGWLLPYYSATHKGVFLNSMSSLVDLHIIPPPPTTRGTFLSASSRFPLICRMVSPKSILQKLPLRRAEVMCRLTGAGYQCGTRRFHREVGLFIVAGGSMFKLIFLGGARDAGNESYAWTPRENTSNWWFPLRGPLGSFPDSLLSTSKV